MSMTKITGATVQVQFVQPQVHLVTQLLLVETVMELLVSFPSYINKLCTTPALQMTTKEYLGVLQHSIMTEMKNGEIVEVS